MITKILDLISKLCTFLITKNHQINKIFYFSWFVLAIVAVSSFFVPGLITFAKLFGQASLVVYVLTLVPGISQRFRLHHMIFNVLQVYRRELGISMFMLSLVHMVMSLYFPMPTSMIMGLVSVSILFFLFITSNDFSVRHLGPHWFTIHRFTYLAMFFIFLHVSWVDFGTTSVLLIIMGITEIASFIYSKSLTISG